MSTQISSKLTFLYKVVLPIHLIGFFAFIALTTRAHDASRPLPFEFLIVGLIGVGVTLWHSARLKVVTLEGDHLIVSNFRDEETVLLADVDEITQSRFWNPVLITLRLRDDYRWGNKIVFAPPWRFQFTFMDHPLVEELEEKVAQARASHPRSAEHNGGAISSMRRRR